MSDKGEGETLHCPECGHNGHFDGLGYEYRERPVIGTDGGQTIAESRYRFHCPECGGEFLTVEEKDER